MTLKFWKKKEDPILTKIRELSRAVEVLQAKEAGHFESLTILTMFVFWLAFEQGKDAESVKQQLERIHIDRWNDIRKEQSSLN